MNAIALCKFRGMLVLVEIAPCSPEQTGRCPDCGGTVFRDHAGWAECDNPTGCGFAVLQSHMRTGRLPDSI
jgi:hypothetical protein